MRKNIKSIINRQQYFQIKVTDNQGESKLINNVEISLDGNDLKIHGLGIINLDKLDFEIFNNYIRIKGKGQKGKDEILIYYDKN